MNQYPHKYLLIDAWSKGTECLVFTTYFVTLTFQRFMTTNITHLILYWAILSQFWKLLSESFLSLIANIFTVNSHSLIHHNIFLAS